MITVQPVKTLRVTGVIGGAMSLTMARVLVSNPNTDRLGSDDTQWTLG